MNMSVRRSSIIPNKPTLTEKNLPDQSGKVFLITGASGGLGKELANILYQRNGKIYMAARSQSKTDEVIKEIKATHPSSKGEMIFLGLVLDDLTTIKRSAEEFLAQESRLDVLPQRRRHGAASGLQNGPGLRASARRQQSSSLPLRPVPPTHSRCHRPHCAQKLGSCRLGVINAADAAPTPAIDFDNMDYHNEEGIWNKYSRSKAGNVLHSVEFTRRTAGEGIISVALNPGNFVTNLQQNMPKIQLAMFRLLTSHPKNGAYTQLFAGLSPTITEKDNGAWVSPFGKVEPARKDLLDAELCKKYWDWSEEQVKSYL